jgi:hypothetical protein
MAKGKRRFFRVFFVCVVLFALAVGGLAGFSFVGRVGPEAVISGLPLAYVRIPDPADFLASLAAHESLPEILSAPEFAFLLPFIADVRSSGILDTAWLRFAGKGRLDAALLSEGRFFAAWDMGVMSGVLRFLPWLAGQVTIPNLYYVQAGKASRFEYRLDDGSVFYAAPYKNLLVVSNNSRLFESVLLGAPEGRDGRGLADALKVLGERGDYGLAALVSPKLAVSSFSGAEPFVRKIMGEFEFSGFSGFEDFAGFTLNFFPRRIEAAFVSGISAKAPGLAALLERDSPLVSFLNLLPDTAQYSSVFSAGSPRELLAAASSLRLQELEAGLLRAEGAAKSLLGMSIDELVFSWMGSEFAAFGLAGKPYPVFAVAVSDEARRREVFDSVFSSFFVSESVSTVLDGTRIPQIRLPSFLDSVLRLWDVVIPAPFYYVQDGFLFLSQSPESLIAALSAIRKNSVLVKSELWKALASSSGDKSAFSLFYSLDSGLPFFLKGNTALNSVLRLYGQGLARFSLEGGVLTCTLSAIPGEGRGLRLFSGYPLDVGSRVPSGGQGEKMGGDVYALLTSRKGEARILLARGGSAFSVNAADNAVYEYGEFRSAGGTASAGEVFCIPAGSLALRGMEEPAAWVVTREGQAALVNANMKAVKGFPLVTGVNLSAKPAAFDGRLFLADEDGSVYAVDKNAHVSRLEFPFDGAALRSPPGFLDTGGKKYMGMYPKSFSGSLWLASLEGDVYPGWPVQISGIAFGSPLLFTREGAVFAAFITQAGELFVFDEAGLPVSGFPCELDGVFHIQPVWDGASLWVLSAKGVLHEISLDARIQKFEIPNLRAGEGAVLCADVDRDGTAEIFVTGEANALYGYSRFLLPLAGFPLPVWGRPAFADLNGDGVMECVGAGLDNLLYRWQLK